MKLKALDNQSIENILKNIINSGYMLVVITLIDGNLLFGRFRPNERIFSENPEKFENKDLWVKKYDERFKGFLTYKIKPVDLVFNNRVIEIDYELIFDIKPLYWTNRSIPFRYHGDIPSTLLSIISNHNIKVATKNDLKTFIVIFNVLPVNDIIKEEGIKFSNDEIIYIDWDFISRISGGTSLSVNVSISSLNPGRTDYQLAIDKIRDGPIEKIAKFLPGKTPIGEKRLSGFLIMPEDEITTTMEGKECIMAFCSENDYFSPKISYIPIILKKKSISYPIELFPYIKSEMVFYGETKQIPINYEEISSDYALMVRAIGYIS